MIKKPHTRANHMSHAVSNTIFSVMVSENATVNTMGTKMPSAIVARISRG